MIAVSILLVLVIGGGAAAAAYVTSKVDKIGSPEARCDKLEINKEVEHKTGDILKCCVIWSGFQRGFFGKRLPEVIQS